MMNTTEPMTDAEIERLLAEAERMEPPVPDPAFLARVLADAAAFQPPVARARPLAREGGTIGSGRASFGGWAQALAELFGGRGALAGMALATVAGLYLGLAQPAVLTALYSEPPLDSLDLLAGGDSLFTEVAQ